jgi:hypothetical protein
MIQLTFTDKEKIGIVEGAGLTITPELETYTIELHKRVEEECSTHVLQVYTPTGERVTTAIGRSVYRMYYVDQAVQIIMKRKLIDLCKNKSRKSLSF